MPEAALSGHVNTAGSPAIEGSPDVFIGGVPILRVGDRFADGGVVTDGAAHVKINDRFAARIGDPVTDGKAVADGCLKVRIGNSGGFDAFRCGLARDATDKEKLLLCIPHIARAIAEREEDENERQGWLYLHDMMIRWLTGMVNRDAKTGHDPFWVDWDWVMGLQEYFPLAGGAVPSPFSTSPHEEYETFTAWFPEPLPDLPSIEPSDNIYNSAAKRSLGKILARNNWPEEFDFTVLPWTEWQDKYHTQRIVPQPVGVSGQQAALGSFTLRALASGSTKKIGEGRYKVSVTGVAVFAYDVFNFEAGGVEWLGYWSCKHGDIKLVNFPPDDGYLKLHNADFRNYQNKYGLGHDYLVFSQPHLVENFKGIEYDCTL